MVVEVTDLVFAVDSIPAIFAITTNTFIVYTSNVFAILGLRSMYFLLAGVVEKFRYLRTGLAIVLTFIGLKMLLGAVHFLIPIKFSLGFVAVVLVGSVVASLLVPTRKRHHYPGRSPARFRPPPWRRTERSSTKNPKLNWPQIKPLASICRSRISAAKSFVYKRLVHSSVVC